MHRFAIMAALALAALALAATAAAEGPTKSTTSSGPETVVIPDLCSFPVTLTATSAVTTITFANGDVQRHIRLENTLSANGKSVTDTDSFQVFIDPSSPSVRTIVGSYTRINVPGGGVLVRESGRIVFDLSTREVLFEAGPHDFTFHGDVAPLCAYLG